MVSKEPQFDIFVELNIFSTNTKQKTNLTK